MSWFSGHLPPPCCARSRSACCRRAGPTTRRARGIATKSTRSGRNCTERIGRTQAGEASAAGQPPAESLAHDRHRETVAARHQRASDDRGGGQGAAAQRARPAAGPRPARSPRQLRRAVRDGQLREDELRHRRVPRARLLHHRQARRRRAERRRRPGGPAARDVHQRSCIAVATCRSGSWMPATRTSKCTAATGRSSGPRRIWTCRRSTSIRRSTTSSRSRSSGSATITRRGSCCRRATWVSGPSNGLVTCLTDGHPGVSGGGVLNRRGDLVGIPIGRMQGDYRFSFILPIRAEMLRKVPGYAPAERSRARRRRRVPVAEVVTLG